MSKVGSIGCTGLFVDVGQKDEKFISTKADDVFEVVENMLQERRRFDQKFVTDVMSQGVIDLFKIIEVDHDNREGYCLFRFIGIQYFF